MNNNLKKITSTALLLSMLLGVSGCNSNKKVEFGYKVESSTNKNENGLYTYIINTDGLVSSNYNFSDNSVNLVKVSKSEEFGTKFSNKKTAAFYRENLKLVWPDCFGAYKMSAWLTETNFDIKLKYEELSDGFGTPYYVIYSSITAKRDLLNNIRIYKDEQKPIQKGDNISSIAIYYDNELVAFNQTGVGCESKNVINSNIGNVNIALSKLDLTESKTITYDELNNIERNMNENNKTKKLTLK